MKRLRFDDTLDRDANEVKRLRTYFDLTALHTELEPDEETNGWRYLEGLASTFERSFGVSLDHWATSPMEGDADDPVNAIGAELNRQCRWFVEARFNHWFVLEMYPDYPPATVFQKLLKRWSLDEHTSYYTVARVFNFFIAHTIRQVEKNEKLRGLYLIMPQSNFFTDTGSDRVQLPLTPAQAMCDRASRKQVKAATSLSMPRKHYLETVTYSPGVDKPYFLAEYVRQTPLPLSPMISFEGASLVFNEKREYPTGLSIDSASVLRWPSKATIECKIGNGARRLTFKIPTRSDKLDYFNKRITPAVKDESYWRRKVGEAATQISKTENVRSVKLVFRYSSLEAKTSDGLTGLIFDMYRTFKFGFSPENDDNDLSSSITHGFKVTAVEPFLLLRDAPVDILPRGPPFILRSPEEEKIFWEVRDEYMNYYG